MSSDFSAYGYYASTGAPAAATITPTASVYGEQRPQFSEDGTGTPYTTIMNLVGSSAVNSDISYDTSSKDPHMIRARVFIGNIARAIIGRDDIIELFRPFGKVSAVNYFAQQGFGFVQFTEAASADKSCLTLNGQQWKGCVLDVHLAMLGAQKKSASGGGGGGGGGGGAVNQPLVPPVSAAPLPVAHSLVSGGGKIDANAPSQKRTYEEDEYDIFKQNKRNKQFANGDKTTNDDLAPNEMCDTLVCGYCRFVTSDFEEFKEHRIAGCNKYKDPEEPRHRLKCATCSQRFLGAWGLLEHLTEFHRMLLYNEEPLTKADLAMMRGMSSGSASASAAPPPSASTPTPSQTLESPPTAGPSAAGTNGIPLGNSAESTPSFVEQSAGYTPNSNNQTPQI